ncbi:hypothetical protein [Deinococcus marmoris]|uniref:hypothetical protein n=1 Tax=Deinococcus marmoris TaxID=249408 RepID=UPI0004955DDF|nr:hypothetical protein [Deinococcus marmoris]
MQADELARVRFHVRPDAWTAWLLLVPEPADQTAQLDQALDVEGDLRGVAAYLLETVCAQAHFQAATAPAAATQIKVGKIELKRAQGSSAAAVQGDDWCSRAATLRGQLAEGARLARRQGSMSIPVEVSF